MKINEFEKLYNKMDYRDFTNLALEIIAQCDLGGLYGLFSECKTAEEINETAEELKAEGYFERYE